MAPTGYQKWTPEVEAMLLGIVMRLCDRAGCKISGQDVFDMWPKDHPMKFNARAFGDHLAKLRKAGPAPPASTTGGSANGTGPSRGGATARKTNAGSNGRKRKNAPTADEEDDDEEDGVGQKGESSQPKAKRGRPSKAKTPALVVKIDDDSDVEETSAAEADAQLRNEESQVVKREVDMVKVEGYDSDHTVV